LDSQHSYGQVAYNYDEAHAANQQEEANQSAADGEEEEDQPFVAPPELDIPVGMILVRMLKNSLLVFFERQVNCVNFLLFSSLKNAS